MGNITFKSPSELSEEKKASLLNALENKRKEQEAVGVTVNGVRYGGEPSNRAALGEALEFSSVTGVVTFSGWKDSDGNFHLDHPVADVQAAYEAIGNRRSDLIAKEGTYTQQIKDGTLTSVEDLIW